MTICPLQTGWLRKICASICALFAFSLAAYADPANFMVENFTFIRPPDWKWVWDEKRSKQGNLLEVTSPSSSETAQIYLWKFKHGDGSPENRTRAWQAYFKESPENLNVHTETKQVGTFSVMYIEINGTHVHRPHPEHALIGAIIKLTDQEHLVVRMSGRKQLVDDSKSFFRTMIERALTEKQQN